MYGPLKLVKNRVWRVYTGGVLLDRFQGASEEKDDFFPEEWVGSTTPAVNEGRDIQNEGLSRCLRTPVGVQVSGFSGQEGEILLKDLISENPEEFLGKEHVKRFGPETGYLVKLLDSAVRLPIQAHPDRAFSAKYLNSSYGKTETWTILDSRVIDGEKPYILFGFKEGVTFGSFYECYQTQDVEGMISSLNRVEVKRGDVFVIPGRVPHAIGSGVFLIEVQEPTDFVFQLDKKGVCWDLSPFQVHMDLGDEKMFESFDFKAGDVLSKNRSFFDFSKTVQGVQPLLPESLAGFFGASRIYVSDRLEKEHTCFTIGICIKGSGTCIGNHGSISLKQGETFCVPACNSTITYTSGDDCLEVVETYPPRHG